MLFVVSLSNHNGTGQAQGERPFDKLRANGAHRYWAGAG